MCELLCTLHLTVNTVCISTQIFYQCFFSTADASSYVIQTRSQTSLLCPFSLLFTSLILCPLSLFSQSPLLNFPLLLFQLSSFVSFPPPISFLFLTQHNVCLLCSPLLSFPFLSSALISSPLASLLHCNWSWKPQDKRLSVRQADRQARWLLLSFNKWAGLEEGEKELKAGESVQAAASTVTPQ